MIPYGRQNISEADIQAVVDVLRSDFITQGPAIERFERQVASYCGARYAVAVSSATAALHIACLSLGIAPGDRVWTSPVTFVASANCALYCGASIDFVDIDPDTYNLGIKALTAKLEEARAKGQLPKLLIPVHLAGQSCEMEAIEQLAVAYGFTVLEDASHAIGGHYQQGKIGSCERSALTVFSFHPVKIVTTGEGGMVLTNNPVLYKKLLLLRSHGITRNREEMQTVLEPGESPAPWVYQQIALGYNYRMTDIQAALGFSQMQRIDEFITRRHGLANRYNTQLQHLPVVLPWQHPETYSSFHLYIIRLKTADITVTHRQVFEALREKGIGVNLHYIPVHTQPHYQNLGFQAGDFPEAEAYYQQAISLPLYYDLKEEEQDFIIEGLRDVLLRGKA